MSADLERAIFFRRWFVLTTLWEWWLSITTVNVRQLSNCCCKNTGNMVLTVVPRKEDASSEFSLVGMHMLFEQEAIKLWGLCVIFPKIERQQRPVSQSPPSPKFNTADCSPGQASRTKSDGACSLGSFQRPN